MVREMTLDSKTLRLWKKEAEKDLRIFGVGNSILAEEYNRILALIDRVEEIEMAQERMKFALEEIHYNAGNHQDNSISSEWLCQITRDALKGEEKD